MHVGHDADDRPPRIGVLAQLDAPAKGIGPAEESLHEPLGDDRNRRRLGLVRLGEGSPSQRLHVEHVEVAVGDDDAAGPGMVLLRRICGPVDRQAQHLRAARREIGRIGDRSHARQGPDPGKITAEHIDETFDTNVKGTIFTVQKALPLMGQGGSIILTGSSAGTTGAPAFTAYSASKAAVRNLARTWAEDLKGTGIRVNVLSPGATATELAKEALGEEGQKVFASMTPLQRMADPAEIGAVAAFLASSDSSFMTASEVAVDGGLAQL